MSVRGVSCARGMTLIEVVLAVAILAVVLGVTAQAIGGFYITMDVQEQRIEAVQSARAVLGAVREKRTEFDGGEDGFDWAGLLGWIEGQNQESWAGFVRGNELHEDLRDHTIGVEVYNMDGGAASAGDNPVEVHAIAAWVDRQGRAQRAVVVTVMTNV